MKANTKDGVTDFCGAFSGTCGYVAIYIYEYI
jgi:hypothetical protein